MRGLRWTFYILVLSQAFGACGKLTTEEDASSVSNPPVGVVDDSAGFYVRYVNNSNYTYYMHRGGTDTASSVAHSDSYDYTLECKIAEGETDIKDIVCYLETDELDLYFNGVELQHNVPSGMCSYLQILMPWYYKYPVGTGPNTVTLTTNDGVITDVNNSVNGTPYCPYDFSSWLAGTTTSAAGSADAGPNCCLGTYSKSTTTVTTGPPADSSSSTEEAKWNGKVKDCMSGPAMDLQTVDANGRVFTDISYVHGKGANGTYLIPAPISKSLLSNVYVANYYTPSGSATFNDVSAYPAAFNINSSAGPNIAAPTLSPGGSDSSGLVPGLSNGYGQPFYEYRCFNTARELNYRIRVLVRSWDVEGDAGVSTGPYQVSSGVEPSPFDLPYFPLHDHNVWDDFFPSGELTPPVSSYTNWNTGFPMTSE
jgi:hypothetical protein